MGNKFKIKNWDWSKSKQKEVDVDSNKISEKKVNYSDVSIRNDGIQHRN